MKIPSNILTLLAGIILTLVSLWYGQNHGLLPEAASDEAALIDGLFNSMMTVSIGLFVLVQGVLIISAFKFRRSAGDRTDGPPIHGNIPLEIVWTAIPAVIVLMIGVYSFDVYKAMGGFDPQAAPDPGIVQVALLPGEEGVGPLLDGSTPAKPTRNHGHHHMALGVGAFPNAEGRPADVSIDVMGIQYAWIFTYPQSGITTGEIHIPVNKEVQLNIKAQDVLHAFWLPEFRLKQDAIPGRDAELRFVPRRLGTYPVICAELCGPYHGAMNTKLYVESQEDFDKWQQEQIASLDNSNETVAALVESDRLASASGERSDAAYLAPFARQMTIDAASAVEQLHSGHPTDMHHLMPGLADGIDQALEHVDPSA